jgi:hypothetical protein
MKLPKRSHFPAVFAFALLNTGKNFRYDLFIASKEKEVHLSFCFLFSGRRKIMSSISSVNSNSILNILLNSLTNSESSDSSQNTESESTDAEQATSESTLTSKLSLSDQLKISSLQNQCSFMTSLWDSNNSTPSESQNSFWENEKSTNNSQLAQLLATLNSSSSSSSGNNDIITSLLQSLDGSNSDSLQTMVETLLKSSGSDVNSETLNQYLSLLSNTSSLIKTTV